MTLTPRQIAAYLEIAEQLDRVDRANDIVVSHIGAQGDKASVEKAIKELGG